MSGLLMDSGAHTREATPDLEQSIKQAHWCTSRRVPLTLYMSPSIWPRPEWTHTITIITAVIQEKL